MEAFSEMMKLYSEAESRETEWRRKRGNSDNWTGGIKAHKGKKLCQENKDGTKETDN
jgi:hypothetical protein